MSINKQSIVFNDILAFLRKTFKGVGSFYLVGGAVRDALLDKDFTDIDIATSLRPEEIKAYLPEADYTFLKSGTVNYKYMGYSITFATMREEGEYLDYRHPSSITFIDDYLNDSKRRDFTINAIYISSSSQILDPQGGLLSLKKKEIKMIGDPDIRLKEDPLRIIRALRFEIELDFDLDKDLRHAIKRNIKLLEKINPQKIKAEIEKLEPYNQERLKTALLDYTL